MAIVLEIDRDLAEIVPGYLANRRSELPIALSMLEAGDFTGLKSLGHGMKGSGGGYGLDFISELGGRIEKSALAGDRPVLARQLGELKEFLEQVEIKYV